nr:YfhO family protein [Candidatus Omnitrophota bacterium]
KELAVPFLIVLFYAHFFLSSFTWVAYIELKLLMGRALLVKLQPMMQLAGGLFAGIVLQKVLLANLASALRGLKPARIFSWSIAGVYGTVSLFLLAGTILYKFFREIVNLLAERIFTILFEQVKLLSSFKERYADSVAVISRDVSHALLDHFFNSEFTVHYVLIALSRLVLAILFVLALNRASKVTVSVRRRAFLIIVIAVSLFAVERVSLLKLYCAFNRDAPKNFSSEYREISYLKEHIRNNERAVVVTNAYKDIISYVSTENKIALGSQNTLKGISRDEYYRLWSKFPESGRNGMPLMLVFNMPHGIGTPTGLFAVVLKDIWDVYNRIRSTSGESAKTPGGYLEIYDAHSPLLDLIGVKYIMSSIPLKEDRLVYILKGDKYFLYENKSAFPRTWIVDRLEVERDHDKTLVLMAGDVAGLRRSCFTEEDVPDLDANDRELIATVRIAEGRANSVKIDAETNKASMLVLSDTYFKDWRVFVNGKRGDIIRVNHFMRGVLLEPGKSSVVFEFAPKVFYISMALSIAGFIMVLIYLLADLSSGIWSARIARKRGMT